ALARKDLGWSMTHQGDNPPCAFHSMAQGGSYDREKQEREKSQDGDALRRPWPLREALTCHRGRGTQCQQNHRHTENRVASCVEDLGEAQGGDEPCGENESASDPESENRSFHEVAPGAR